MPAEPSRGIGGVWHPRLPQPLTFTQTMKQHKNLVGIHKGSLLPQEKTRDSPRLCDLSCTDLAPQVVGHCTPTPPLTHGEGNTHRVNAKRVGASENSGDIWVQLQSPAVPDGAVTKTESRADHHAGRKGPGKGAPTCGILVHRPLTSKAPSSFAPPESGWSCTWQTRSTQSQRGSQTWRSSRCR